MNSNEPQRNAAWKSIRWPFVIIGLVLLIVGQFLIASNKIPSAPPLQLGKWLNDNWHLDIPTIDNVLRGLPVLILGAILLINGLQGLKLVPSDDFVLEMKPIGLRLMRYAWLWMIPGLVIFSILLVQLSKLDYSVLSPIMWVVTLLIFAVITAAWDRRRGVNISPGLTRRDLIWLCGLVLAGFIIGTYRLQGMPDQLIGDEGNFWTTARDIAIGAYHPGIFGNGVYSFPIFSSIVQAYILKIFGTSLWGWRLSSVFAGIITIPPLYLLARDAFDRRIAIASSIALIVCPYFIAFSRLGYNNIQALFIAALTSYFLYAGLRKNSYFLLYLAGCAAGLGFYTFLAARGACFVAGAFIVLLWLTKKLKFRQAAVDLILLFIGVALAVAPYVVYGTRENAQSMGFKSLENIFFNVFYASQYYTNAELFKYAPVFHLGGNDLYFNPVIYLVLFIRGLIRSILVFQKPWLVSEHFIAFPLAGTVGVIFYLIGLGVVLKTIKEPRSQYLIIWFLTNLLVFSALDTIPPRHTHMVALIPALALLTGIGVNALTRTIAYVHPWLREHFILFFSILLGILAAGGLVDYFITMPRYYPPEQEQIMSWALLDSHGEQFFYITNDPSETNFSPYIKTEIMQSARFNTIQIPQFVDSIQSYTKNSKTVIFYHPDLASQITPLLQAQWGSKFVQRTFVNTDGTPLLVAGMNSVFTFERDRTFLTTLVDSYHYLSLIILLVALAGLLILFAFLPTTWMTRLPQGLKPLADWFNRKEPPIVENVEEEPVIDIGTSVAAEPELAAEEPPEWITEFSRSNPIQNPKRLKSNFKLIKTDLGKEFYFRIFIPALTLPWRRSSQEIEFSIPVLHIPNPLLLVLSVFTAVVAQLLASGQYTLPTAGAYLLSAGGLVAWAVKNPKWKNVFTNQVQLSTRIELFILAAILIAAAFFRFYDLSYRVYGLEADETKWTVQSWYSAILRVDKGDFATMHYKYLPVDFWLKSFFLRLFGLNFVSARIESAFLSLLSVGLLYLLVRRLSSSKPLALLTSLLFAFSFVELNLAHQALAETSPEIWILSSFTCFLLALQKQKLWLFQITGVLIAAGMMSYDTFLPCGALILLYLFAFGLTRILRHKASIKHWLQVLLLTAWPAILVYFGLTRGYLAARQGYQFGMLMNSTANLSNLIAFYQFLGKNITDLLTTLFSHVVWTDSLLNWPGPFVNPILLPFIVIGLVYNLWNLRRPHFALIPLWFLINIIIGPLLLGTVWPRVLYPTLIPLMIWAAMGLWTLLSAARAWLDAFRLKLAVPLFALLIVVILFNDYHIFTSSLIDATDRQKRRELADLTVQSASRTPMALFPYEPNQNDTNEVESHVILFSVASATHLALQADTHYNQILFDQILPTLWQDHKLPALDLFYDKTADSMTDQRSQTLQIVLNCYPGATLSSSGRFFDVYHFNAQTLSQPRCYQSANPVITTPPDGAVFPPSSPLILTWNPNGTASTSFSVSIQRRVPGNFLIEAEDAFQGSGWYTSAFVNGFTGSGFIQDSWNSGPTSYNFQVPQAGQYRIWIRTYKRRENDQHNFVSINGTTTEIAQNGTTLNDWVWDDLGLFSLQQGPLPISLSRTYGKDEEYSVLINSLMITTNLSQSPSDLKIWDTAFESGEISSTATQYQIPQPLPDGDYRWLVRLFDGSRLIDSTGSRGIQSPLVSFSIEP